MVVIVSILRGTRQTEDMAVVLFRPFDQGRLGVNPKADLLYYKLDVTSGVARSFVCW